MDGVHLCLLTKYLCYFWGFLREVTKRINHNPLVRPKKKLSIGTIEIDPNNRNRIESLWTWVHPRNFISFECSECVDDLNSQRNYVHILRLFRIYETSSLSRTISLIAEIATCVRMHTVYAPWTCLLKFGKFVSNNNICMLKWFWMVDFNGSSC